MTTPMPLAAERLRALYRDALAERRPGPYRREDPDDPLSGVDLHYAPFGLEVEQLRFVAVAVALRPEPDLLPEVEHALQLLERTEDDWGYDHAAAAEVALALYLRRTPLGEAELLRWTGDPSAAVRAGAAGALGPDVPSQRAALEGLLTDRDAGVRRLCAARLGVTLPWWAHAFSVDPLAGVADADRQRVEGAARALEATAAAKGPIGDAEAARDALLALPVPAAEDAAARLFVAHAREAAASHLLDPFLTPPFDPERLLRVLGPPDLLGSAHDRLREALARLPEARRIAVTEALAPHVSGDPSLAAVCRVAGARV